MSSSKKYKQNAKPTQTENQTRIASIDVLRNTIHHIVDLTTQLLEEVDKISPPMKTYEDLEIKLNQTRFYLPMRTTERFQSAKKNIERFGSETQQIDAETKRFLVALVHIKQDLETFAKDDPESMMEWLIERIRDFDKTKLTVMNLKKKWDDEKGNMKYEIMGCIRLAEELGSWLKEAGVKGWVTDSSKMSNKKDSPSSANPNWEGLEKLYKMKDCMSTLWSLKVFVETLEHIDNVLIRELGRELSKVHRKIERFKELQLEVKQSRFAPLVPRIAARFAFVEQKEDYFFFKLKWADDENAKLKAWIHTPEFQTKEHDDQVAMMKKSIEKNRSACELMVTVRRLKDEWEAVKEEVVYEATECVRLVEELHTRFKSESKK